MPDEFPPTVLPSSKKSNSLMAEKEGTFHASRSNKKHSSSLDFHAASEQQNYEEWHRDRHGSFRNGNSRSHHAAESGAMPGARRSRSGNPRWSFVLQDLPHIVRRAVYDVQYGYVARVGLVAAGALTTIWAVYFSLARIQKEKPLAQRWWIFSPSVPVTLIERKQVDGSNMYWYRFALPNSYDYAGYEPISSVEIRSGEVGSLSSVKRWYTPISHPEERGIIEFAIKDCDPGRMSARLRNLKVGDQVHLGRWMKEFRYNPNQHQHIGLICTTGGASVALQLLYYLDRQPMYPTCLSLLYCNSSPFDIPFRRLFQEFEKRDNRFSVKFNVMSMGIEAYKDPEKILPNGLIPGKNLFTGNLSPNTIQKTMPPPLVPLKWSGAGENAVDKNSLRKNRGSSALAKCNTCRPPLLICGPQSMLTFVSGKVSTIGHLTYWQGPFYKYYTGFLGDLGYERKQVYKFGVSKHFMAIQ